MSRIIVLRRVVGKTRAILRQFGPIIPEPFGVQPLARSERTLTKLPQGSLTAAQVGFQHGGMERFAHLGSGSSGGFRTFRPRRKTNTNLPHLAHPLLSSGRQWNGEHEGCLPSCAISPTCTEPLDCTWATDANWSLFGWLVSVQGVNKMLGMSLISRNRVAAHSSGGAPRNRNRERQGEKQ